MVNSFKELINELQNINLPSNINNILIDMPEIKKNINTNFREDSINYLLKKSKTDSKGAFRLGSDLLDKIKYENQIAYGGKDTYNKINTICKCINILLIIILLLFLIGLIIYLIKINKKNTKKCLINTYDILPIKQKYTI